MKYIASIQPWKNKNYILDQIELLEKNNIHRLRINTKPCSKDEHYDALNRFIGEIIKKNSNFKFLIDIGFPNDSFRIRIGKSPYYIDVNRNDCIELTNSEHGNLPSIGIRNINVFNFLNVNDILIYGDGEIQFCVVYKKNNGVTLQAENAGRMWDGKSLHFVSPVKDFKAREDLRFIQKFLSNIPFDNLNGIIASFVEKEEDVIKLKNLFDVRIISKLETHKGIKNIKEDVYANIQKYANKMNFYWKNLYFMLMKTEPLELIIGDLHSLPEIDKGYNNAKNILNGRYNNPYILKIAMEYWKHKLFFINKKIRKQKEGIA